MNNRKMVTYAGWKRPALLGVLLAMIAGGAAAQSVSQVPLSVGAGVPGNLLLTPSVEWPTIDSVANISDDYDIASTYTGYFDSGKCYKYSSTGTESKRFFYPVTVTGTAHTCNGADFQWSGNYLNWAATQTIDPFRKALTGGLRVAGPDASEQASVTYLEKARSDDNTGTSIFPDRDIANLSSTNRRATAPLASGSWSTFKTRIRKLGSEMWFTEDGNLDGSTAVVYNNQTLDGSNKNTVFTVSIRVRVCDAAFPESNCVQYGSYYKPEGLIQKYANKIRYSVFGYLNDNDPLRDGAAMRARQKFVGPLKLDPATNTYIANGNKEWNPSTGVLVQNPDSADATATTGTSPAITNSGVINYLNKFGQMTTNKDHKNYDPVSEMYYAAIRYLRNFANVPEYTTLSGDGANKYIQADGFPVITSWDDPIQYSCQNNAILGIGDVNTWNDQNLKGVTSRSNEPSTPSLVSSDTVSVKTWLDRVATIEGITIPTSPDFTGRNNSAYMVGLAYYAHTTDLRTEASMTGMQTVSTHWVDVRENRVLQPKANNQYWLAAKYGGFNVPDNYDATSATAPLPSALWSSGETLSTGDPRPENFYVASEADKMVESLTRAFAKISSESVGSSTSLAANSTRLDTDTRTFQAQFTSSWSGDIKAYSVSTTGALSASPLWTASATTSLAAANWASRAIYSHNPANNTLLAFTWANLTAAQKTSLVSSDVVDYLRGNRAKEESQANGIYRTRARGLIGDIVNSTPVYVAKPSTTLYNASMGFPGASSYAAFAAAKSTRQGVIWVGANDGMLHAFNADTGQEIFAFVPKTAITNGLNDYSSPTYAHKYFVDGDIAVADAYDGTNWRTILVGTMGRGGAGAFALDVTTPTAAGITLLWDKDGGALLSDIPGLGKNLGKPVIAQTASGVWQVLIGNGPGSYGSTAKLIAINVFTGATTTISTDLTGSNGLSAVLARDNDGDNFAETIYAGDLLGKLWKITNVAGTPSATTMFVAKDATNAVQPITAAPLAGKDSSTGLTWVFFGTGKYFSDTDAGVTQTQTWYGIQDTGTVPTRATLAQRSVITQAAVGTVTARTVTNPATGDMVGKYGWYIDLPSSGERMTAPNQFQSGALIGTTRIPDSSNVCQPTGKGFVMAISPFTGGRLSQTFFDLNGDALFNNSDKLSGTIVSGLGFDSDVNAPIFVGDVMLTSLGSEPPGASSSVDRRKIQGSSVDSRRLTWREIRN